MICCLPPETPYIYLVGAFTVELSDISDFNCFNEFSQEDWSKKQPEFCQQLVCDFKSI